MAARDGSPQVSYFGSVRSASYCMWEPSNRPEIGNMKKHKVTIPLVDLREGC